ncbi:hypothetical protein C0J52_14704 [Blattella germanica]|nr:hypothetical protein C0J52_14704 [Blattella germanica]
MALPFHYAFFIFISSNVVRFQQVTCEAEEREALSSSTSAPLKNVPLQLSLARKDGDKVEIIRSLKGYGDLTPLGQYPESNGKYSEKAQPHKRAIDEPELQNEESHERRFGDRMKHQQAMLNKLYNRDRRMLRNYNRRPDKMYHKQRKGSRYWRRGFALRPVYEAADVDYPSQYNHRRNRFGRQQSDGDEIISDYGNYRGAEMEDNELHMIRNARNSEMYEVREDPRAKNRSETSKNHHQKYGHPGGRIFERDADWLFPPQHNNNHRMNRFERQQTDESEINGEFSNNEGEDEHDGPEMKRIVRDSENHKQPSKKRQIVAGSSMLNIFLIILIAVASFLIVFFFVYGLVRYIRRY